MTDGLLAPAVVLGGSYNSVSVTRALGRQGIAVHALGDGAGGSLVESSKYLSSYVPVSSSSAAADEWMTWLRTGPRGAVLLPCSDGALQFLAEHRAELVGMGYHPAAGADEVTLAMLDKELTYELARQVGVPAPRTAAVQTMEELRAAAAGMDFPCALKPRHSHLFARTFDGKALIAQDAAELETAFEATSEAGLDMIVTEIIPGDDDRYCSYYSYLDDDGTPLFDFTKRKPRQNPPGFGLGTFHVTEWVPDAAELGRRFFTGIGLRGLGNVEFKRDSRDGQLKIIECNPRFTAGDPLVQRAGIDLATMTYRRALGLPVTAPTSFRSGVRQWHPMEDLYAFRAYRAAGKLSTAAWLRSVLPPVGLPMFDRGDLRPTLVYLSGFSRRAARAVGRRVKARVLTSRP